MSNIVESLVLAVFTLLATTSTLASASRVLLQQPQSNSFLKSLVAFGDSYSDAGAPWGRWIQSGGRAPLATFYPSNGVSSEQKCYGAFMTKI